MGGLCKGIVLQEQINSEFARRFASLDGGIDNFSDTWPLRVKRPGMLRHN